MFKKMNEIEKTKMIEEKEKRKKDHEKEKADQVIINELVQNWQNTFGNLKNWNSELNGFTLNNLEVETYGVHSRIYAPWGMDLNELEKRVGVIESGCKCQFLYSIPEHRKFAMAKFIYPEQVKINEKLFTPVKVKPYEFFPGFDESGDPVIFNLNDTPHILDAGQQRRGKNGAIDHAIVSWIHSCSEEEITLYLFQCAKNDFIKYKDCKQVYCYANTLDHMLIALEHLADEAVRRTNLFEPMTAKGTGNDNIFHYNILHQGNQLPYVIVIIDEFIELMPDTSMDDKGTVELKKKILKYLQKIGQWGGSLGINYCCLHQKPSRELMPVFIKNQSSVRLCFGFEDLTCCEIVLGPGLAKMAFKLPPRKAFYSNNDTNGYLYTSNLKGRIRMFIEPSIQVNHRDLFRDMKIANAPPKAETFDEDEDDNEIPIKENYESSPIFETEFQEWPKENNAPNNEFNKVDPSKVIEMGNVSENIKNIPNFVPYNPTSLTSLKSKKFDWEA